MAGVMKPTMISGTRKKMICPKMCRSETTTSITASLATKPSSAPSTSPANSLRISETSPILAILILRNV